MRLFKTIFVHCVLATFDPRNLMYSQAFQSNFRSSFGGKLSKAFNPVSYAFKMKLLLYQEATKKSWEDKVCRFFGGLVQENQRKVKAIFLLRGKRRKILQDKHTAVDAKIGKLFCIYHCNFSFSFLAVAQQYCFLQGSL